MAKKKVKTLSRFIGGIAECKRESTTEDGYAFGRSIDVRTDPQIITLLPRTIKESGNVIQALPKWGEYISSCSTTYMYDEAGNIYDRNSSGTYSLLHTVPNSHGNGMSWFGEDNFIYYTSDKLIGRYGPVCSSTATFVDDFFGSQGGTPLNTNSLDLEAASSQYATCADTATLSITGNLSIEAWIKPESLPAAGQTMTLVSKWTENGNLRSYKFGIGTVSNYFGDGSDGALTISVNTTEAPIDSAFTGTSGAYTGSATNASFAADQIVLIHQTRGTGAGQWMRNKIQSYTAGTITFVEPLNATYVTKAQVRVLKQHTNVTVNSGITYTAKAWNGTVGGILGFIANGTVTITGAINASGGPGGGPGGDPIGAGGGTEAGVGRGFSGGTGLIGQGTTATAGEGSIGPAVASQNAANGTGGGAGASVVDPTKPNGASGGGGGHATAGGVGTAGFTGGVGGAAGGTSGAADLTTMTFGGGGGGSDGGNGGAAGGGAGGGIVFIAGVTTTITGSINANGGGGGQSASSGGGGAGGSILLKAQVATLGAALITATGGAGLPGLVYPPDSPLYVNRAGDGGAGRVHLDYLTSYTGTSSPTLDVTQDATLGSSSGYTLFLSISTNGTSVTTYTKPANLVIGAWQNAGCAYDFSIGDTEFTLSGVSLGTYEGASTTIHDNASTFNVGADLDGSSAAQHFYDGLIDEVRVFAGVRAVEDIVPQLYQHINTASTGLQGYYQFNAVATDATANANNLTLTNAPVYSTDVPFSAATTRVDIDQASATSGNTYALTTAIVEDSANKKSFTPTKDPQKSLRIYVAAKGTGDWTLTIHDQYNNIIATKTVLNAALPSSGNYEFIFSSVWRPLTNFTNAYHFHITSTVADGTIRTSSANDLSTVDYTTYYQFLVEDTNAHPVAKMLQFLVFGNERYVASLEATIYDPHALTLPAGYRVRCFGYWQEYLAIGVMKGDAITDQDMGRIYFWDGIAGSYNFYVDVPQGGVTALLGAQGLLFLWAGYQGDMLVYSGGNAVTKLRRLPSMESTAYAETYPGAVTMWKSLIRYGTGASDSTDISRGVYTYGSTNYKYPDILTYDYPISTGNTQTASLRIGLTMTLNQRLLIGWSDGTGYGVDYVDDDNACYPTGTIEFMVSDDNVIWKEKLLNTYVVKCKTLTAGLSITPKLKFEDATTWTSGTATDSSSEDPTMSRFINTDERYYESQYALDIETTTGVSPIIKGIGIEVDILESEERV